MPNVYIDSDGDFDKFVDEICMITETEYMCYFIHKQIGITPCEITDEHYESTDGRFAFYVCPVQEIIMKNKRYKNVKYKL